MKVDIIFALSETKIDRPKIIIFYLSYAIIMLPDKNTYFDQTGSIKVGRNEVGRKCLSKN